MLKIKEIRESKNITQDELVALTGIPKRSYVNYENGQTDIPLSKLQNIATSLNVSISELVGETKSIKNAPQEKGNILGNNLGNEPKVKNMFPNEAQEEKPYYNEDRIPVFHKAEFSYPEDYKGIPLIPIDAMAGFGSGEIQVMDYDTSFYRIPEFEELKTDFMIRVKGSSMYPKYSSGDLVACKKLFLNDIFFQWNKIYVLDTEQGPLIKRIKKGSDQEHILIVSENPAYDPFELHLSKVYGVAIVVGVIRLE